MRPIVVPAAQAPSARSKIEIQPRAAVGDHLLRRPGDPALHAARGGAFQRAPLSRLGQVEVVSSRSRSPRRARPDPHAASRRRASDPARRHALRSSSCADGRANVAATATAARPRYRERGWLAHSRSSVPSVNRGGQVSDQTGARPAARAASRIARPTPGGRASSACRCHQPTLVRASKRASHSSDGGVTADGGAPTPGGSIGISRALALRAVGNPPCRNIVAEAFGQKKPVFLVTPRGH